MIEAAVLAPGGEVAGGLRVGFPGIGIPDIGGEELKDSFCSGSVWSEQGGEGDPGSCPLTGFLCLSLRLMLVP